MSIQDDIDKLGASGNAKGQCAKCGDENPYSSIVCSGCGARLPWADAVSDKARATASTHAPLSIASARATVNPGASGSGSGSGGSRGLVTPTVATMLLIVGGLIGAAVVVPNFVSRSAMVQPTPAAELQAPRSAQAAPSSVPTYQAPVAQAPQEAPPAQDSTLVQRSRRAAASAPQAPARQLQLPAVDAVSNVPQLVADISQDIRGAQSKQEAEAVAFACRGLEQDLQARIRRDLDNRFIWGEWSVAMSQLANAAEYKDASFDDPGGAIGQTKLYTMASLLTAAQGSAVQTQRLIEEKNNPALAQQHREEFRRRMDYYEAQQRPVNGPVIDGRR